MTEPTVPPFRLIDQVAEVGSRMAELLLTWSWVFRRVETIDEIRSTSFRRHTVLHFRLPEEGRLSDQLLTSDRSAGAEPERSDDAKAAGAESADAERAEGRFLVPLTVLNKGTTSNFDFTDDRGQRLSPLIANDRSSFVYGALVKLAADPLKTGASGSSGLSEALGAVDDDLRGIADTDPTRSQQAWLELESKLSSATAQSPWLALKHSSQFRTLAASYAVGSPLIVEVAGRENGRRLVSFSYRDQFGVASDDSRQGESQTRAARVSTWLGWQALEQRIPMPALGYGGSHHARIIIPAQLKLASYDYLIEPATEPPTRQDPSDSEVEAGTADEAKGDTTDLVQTDDQAIAPSLGADPTDGPVETPKPKQKPVEGKTELEDGTYFRNQFRWPRVNDDDVLNMVVPNGHRHRARVDLGWRPTRRLPFAGFLISALTLASLLAIGFAYYLLTNDPEPTEPDRSAKVTNPVFVGKLFGQEVLVIDDAKPESAQSSQEAPNPKNPVNVGSFISLLLLVPGLAAGYLARESGPVEDAVTVGLRAKLLLVAATAYSASALLAFGIIGSGKQLLWLAPLAVLTMTTLSLAITLRAVGQPPRANIDAPPKWREAETN